MIAALVAMQLAPLAGCGGGDSGEVPSESENSETGGDEGGDDSAY